MTVPPRSIPHASEPRAGTADDEGNPVLRDALDLAALGLRVLPLRPRSKVPRFPRWTERATADRRALRRWFRRRPDDNLGLLTGGGLVALDIDRDREGLESFERLTRTWGRPPETATAETGSGGMHLLFRVDRPVANRVDVLPGLDVRGDGGLIAVAPSRHPTTGRRYAWIRHPRLGIATAPGWLVRRMVGPGPSRRTPRPADPPARAIAPNRAGDRARLAETVIARFPVPDQGQRHDRMTRAVAHLIGQGFDPALVAAVLGDWYAHFLGRGRVRTGPDEAARELDACLRSTLRKLKRGGFRPATSDRDHEALCRRIHLDAGTRALLAAGTVVTDDQGRKTLVPGPRPGRGPGPDPIPYCKRVTPIGIRLCNSEDERAFVAAVLIQAMHKILHTHEYLQDQVIRMTHDQLRRIASDRHEGLSWRPQQFERLKRKYLTRAGDGKPATRFELLREVRKGGRKRGQASGEPSAYQPTGIVSLLPAAVLAKAGLRPRPPA